MKCVSEIEKTQLQEIASVAGEPHDQIMRNLLIRYSRMESAIKDIEYQIQQSNHPASLGILATIKELK